MDDLRGAKLIASSILTAAGAVSMGLGHLSQGLGYLLGLVLLAIGIPLMVIHWLGPKRHVTRDFREPPEPDIESGFKEVKN